MKRVNVRGSAVVNVLSVHRKELNGVLKKVTPLPLFDAPPRQAGHLLKFADNLNSLVNTKWVKL